MGHATILRGGRLIDPVNGIDEIRDVAFRDGVMAPPESAGGAEILDVSGLVIAPGFVDLHVHLRDPGQTHKEDMGTCTLAAVHGGFTTVLGMPNTRPPADCPEVVADILERAVAQAHCQVLQTGALSVGRWGKELTDYAALKAAGATVLTDDGSCIQDAALMLQALQRAKACGLPVIEHCEDDAVCAGGVMHHGTVSERLGLPGQRYATEDLIVARDAVLSAEADWPIHVQHISTAGAVEMVRRAQARGIRMTAEAAPHHILLTDEAVEKYGTNAKMNPPLREETDRLAILEGLRDGTITAIATDHAPHTAEEKAAGMETAPAGIIGLEAVVPLCLTALVHGGVLTLPQFISTLTRGPREVLGLPVGSLETGAVADLVLLDVDHEHELCVADFHSRSLNCPYDGWSCRGRAVGTLFHGCWAVSPRV
ncbi:MAG: dihydroorotase [Lentisphaeria bacterium]|nr:dihydroorotase [Lentisphaeria bacterium]